MPQHLNYRTPDENRLKRGRPEIAVALGVLVAGLSGAGAVFESGNLHFGRTHLVFLLIGMCGGVITVVLGIRNLLRR